MANHRFNNVNQLKFNLARIQQTYIQPMSMDILDMLEASKELNEITRIYLESQAQAYRLTNSQTLLH